MVAIILLNFNQHDYTLKCIDSIIESDFRDFRIILVDNGSTESEYENLRNEINKDERILIERLYKNIGYVGGINYGLKVANQFNAEYLIIMNNDTIIDSKAVGELVKASDRNNKNAIVTGKVYHYDDSKRLQDIGHNYLDKKILSSYVIGHDELDTGQYDEEQERDMIDDVFWIFPRELYKSIGGYCTYFWFNAEQADFAMRAKKIGFKLIFTPSAKLWHKGSVSIGGKDRNPRLVYWYVQSSLIFKFRHLSKFRFMFIYFKMLLEILSTYVKTEGYSLERV